MPVTREGGGCGSNGLTTSRNALRVCVFMWGVRGSHTVVVSLSVRLGDAIAVPKHYKHGVTVPYRCVSQSTATCHASLDACSPSPPCHVWVLPGPCWLPGTALALHWHCSLSIHVAVYLQQLPWPCPTHCLTLNLTDQVIPEEDPSELGTGGASASRGHAGPAALAFVR